MTSLVLIQYQIYYHVQQRTLRSHYDQVSNSATPYFWLCLLFWQDLQDLSYDRMVLCIPFQYITDLIVSLRCEWLGLGDGDTTDCPIHRDDGMIDFIFIALLCFQ